MYKKDKKIRKQEKKVNTNKHDLEYEGWLEKAHLSDDNPIFCGEPRDKNRIPKILEEIKKIWEKYPDLRLCQLIINATYPDPYYLEDEDLIKFLKTYDKRHVSKKELYSGVFWIVSSDLSYNDNLLFRIKTTSEGEVDTSDLTYVLNAKSGKTYNHEKLWEELPNRLREGKPFDYWPRGRVMIANGKATVYINPRLNLQGIKDYIIDKFNLTKENGIRKIRFICDTSEHYKCHLDK